MPFEFRCREKMLRPERNFVQLRQMYSDSILEVAVYATIMLGIDLYALKDIIGRRFY